MTYAEACEALFCKMTKLKELMRSGRLTRVASHGARGLVTRESVEAELHRMAGSKPTNQRAGRRRASPRQEPPPGMRLPKRPEA